MKSGTVWSFNVAINSTCNWTKVQFQGSFDAEPLLYKGETRTVDIEDKNSFGSSFPRTVGTAVKFQEFRLEDYQCGRNRSSSIVTPSTGGPLFVDNNTVRTDTKLGEMSGKRISQRKNSRRIIKRVGDSWVTTDTSTSQTGSAFELAFAASSMQHATLASANSDSPPFSFGSNEKYKSNMPDAKLISISSTPGFCSVENNSKAMVRASSYRFGSPIASSTSDTKTTSVSESRLTESSTTVSTSDTKSISVAGSSFLESTTVDSTIDTKSTSNIGSDLVQSATINTTSVTKSTSVAGSDLAESATVETTSVTKSTSVAGSDLAESATVETTSDTKSTYVTGSDLVESATVETTSDTKPTSVTGSDLSESATVETTSDTKSTPVTGSDLVESATVETTSDTKSTSVTGFDVSRTSTSDTFSTTLPAFVFGLPASGFNSPTDNTEPDTSSLRSTLVVNKGKDKGRIIPSPGYPTESSSQSVVEGCGDSQLLYELQTLEGVRCKFLEIMKTEKKMCSHTRDPFSASDRCASMHDTIEIVETYRHKKGVPHGKGVLKNSKQQVLYEGEWHNGKRCGNGSALIKAESASSTNANGFYTGEWTDNMRNGRGHMIFLSGAKYEGEWLYDKMHGVGKMKFPDGAVLEGVWCENEPRGCGVFTWPDGEREYREYRGGSVVLTGPPCKPLR